MRTRIIESDCLVGNIGQEFAVETDQLEIYGGLTSPISSDVILLNPTHKSQIEAFAANSAKNFGPSSSTNQIEPEPTFLQDNLGIPTLVGRVDCTINDIGEIVPFEFEDSPSGMGITALVHKSVGENDIHQQLRHHYVENLAELPFVVVSGVRKHGTDDHILLGEENYFYESGNTEIPKKLPSDKPVIVKAIPGLQDSVRPYLELQDRAVCPMTSEGDKTYGERLSIYRAIRNVDELLRAEDGELASQALKRRVGSMAMGVILHLHPKDREALGKKGTVKASALRQQAHNYLLNDNLAYVQPFVSPIRVSNPENRKNLIMRIFMAIDPSSENRPLAARALGGCYVARPEMLVHGSSNAVNGAVLLGGSS